MFIEIKCKPRGINYLCLGVFINIYYIKIKLQIMKMLRKMRKKVV